MLSQKLINFIKKYENTIIEEEILLKIKINNVDSIIFISINPDEPKKKYSFYIDSRYLDYCIYNVEKYEDIKSMCEKIAKIIKEYKFTRFSNKLIESDKIEYYNELINAFSEIDEECIEDYQCPICLENEGAMVLKCHHKLCYYCRIKMIKTDAKAKCPLCKSESLYDTTNDLLDETILINTEFDLDEDYDDEYDEESEEEEEKKENEEGEVITAEINNIELTQLNLEREE